jgi:hypothetical protein
VKGLEAMSTGCSEVEFTLSLANGISLGLCATDDESARIVTFLAQAAILEDTLGRLPSGLSHELVVTSGKDNGVQQPGRLTAADRTSICVLEPRHHPWPRQWRLQEPHRDGNEEDNVVVHLQPLSEEEWFWKQLLRLSACIGRVTHAWGGVLLHSGLTAYPGSQPQSPSRSTLSEHGILLAGRSGVGKSTAIQRLPSPWRTLADDVTLVVRDEPGTYWAHPWPTWSRFFGEEAGDGSDTWDVQQAVPLQAIFVLEQGEMDQAEPVGPGQAVCLLAELASQTSAHFLRGMPLDEIAVFNLQRFENLCDLVQAVPAFMLDVSLSGAFWQEIQRVTQN